MAGRAKKWKQLGTCCRCIGLSLILWLSGCWGHGGKRPETCPGKVTVEEALTTLRSYVSQARPLKINGQCRLGFVDDTNEKREYNLPVTLWLAPPYDIFMRGQATMGPQGVVSLGSNQQEFWLSIKPDINTYWWGTWKEASRAGSLQVSPKVVLEALGMVEFKDPSRWRLENRDGYDILSELDDTDAVVKRIIVNPCDYLVYKISYLNEYGETAVVVDLDGYKKLNKGFSLPTRVQITNYLEGEKTDWVRLSLMRSGIEEREFSEQQRERLFAPPKRLRGYDRVIHVTDAGHFQED
jgi:hypothetical protein